ncbi:hypothetical protein D3C81_1743460 [compost metagenome]
MLLRQLRLQDQRLARLQLVDALVVGLRPVVAVTQFAVGDQLHLVQRSAVAAVPDDALAQLRQALDIAAEQLAQLLIDGLHTHRRLEFVMIEALDGHPDIPFVAPVVGELAQ